MGSNQSFIIEQPDIKNDVRLAKPLDLAEMALRASSPSIIITNNTIAQLQRRDSSANINVGKFNIFSDVKETSQNSIVKQEYNELMLNRNPSNGIIIHRNQLHKDASLNEINNINYSKGNQITHMSETNGWRQPSPDKDVHFVKAARDQKRYVLQANQDRESLFDEVSRRIKPGKGGSNDKNIRDFKFNSCSTLFVNGTLSNSDLGETLHCVAIALCCIMRKNNLEFKALKTDAIFSEALYPTIPERYLTPNGECPTEEKLFEFLYDLFTAGEYKSECAVITLVYIERMLEYTEINLNGSNWGRIIVGALLLAAKVWNDECIWNADFLSFLSEIGVQKLNILERWYIKAITFNLSVKSSVYAKYYFELRDIGQKYNRTLTQQPLTLQQAAYLEAKTLYSEEVMRNAQTYSTSVSPSKGNSLEDFEHDMILSSNFSDSHSNTSRSVGVPVIRRAQSDYIFAPIASPAIIM